MHFFDVIFFLLVLIVGLPVVPKMLENFSGFQIFEVFFKFSLVTSSILIAPFALVDFLVNKLQFLVIAKKIGIKPKKTFRNS